MARQRRQRTLKAVETLTHEGENRKNIPTAEYQPVMRDEELNPTCSNRCGGSVRAVIGR